MGLGYDSHRFAEDRELILGGVHIPDHAGLTGHSDGDAVAHAVIDAVLGAAALGNVGSHFPPSDDAWKDADSIELLQASIRVLHAAGGRVVNTDITVICETPKIGPHADMMRERLAMAMNVPVAVVSIKGKTNEGMGWIGSGEGLAVHVVALIDLPISEAFERTDI